MYLDSKLLFKQVFFKTLEHVLLFLISFFQVKLFFLCRNLDGKGIVPYLQPKRFQPYFSSSIGLPKQLLLSAINKFLSGLLYKLTKFAIFFSYVALDVPYSIKRKVCFF